MDTSLSHRKKEEPALSVTPANVDFQESLHTKRIKENNKKNVPGKIKLQSSPEMYIDPVSFDCCTKINHPYC
jgi:hypothetical protein